MTVSLEKTTRPLIRFDDADVDRSTARSYARDIISRVNKPKTNEVMERVAEGLRVDAYDLAEACTDAMRHVATRFGQSMQRRREGEKVAHLAYIAHAVLASHADGLPVMEPGARSPRIAELELEVEHAGVVNQSLARDLTEARETVQLLGRNVRALEREVETKDGTVAAIKAAANDEIDVLRAENDRVLAISAQRDALLAETVAERDEMGAVLLYAFEMLDGSARSRLLGFWDGIEARS